MIVGKKETKIKTIYNMIDANLSNFYSSRQETKAQPGVCSCKRIKNEKEQQIGFYGSQKDMISRAASILMQDNHSEDEQIVGKVLCLVTDYISKILELLNQEYLCNCKANALIQHYELKHKIHFIREENNKFFKLLEEKNTECQSLIQQLEQLKCSKLDIRPITARNRRQNKQNYLRDSLETPNLFDLSEHKSIKSSKISDTCEETKVEAKETIQKTHTRYFKIDASKKQRKSKIFNQNQYSQHSKVYKK